MGSLEDSIGSLAREIETLRMASSSDFETELEQQIAQLAEQIDQLGEQLDEIDGEVVAIKHQLAEQGTEEEATSPPSPPVAPSGTAFTFSGQGDSQSLPFTINSSPWKLKLWVYMKVAGSASLEVYVKDPSQPEGPGRVAGYGFNVEGGINTRETISYIPKGTYYLYVTAPYYDTWTVWVVEL